MHIPFLLTIYFRINPLFLILGSTLVASSAVYEEFNFDVTEFEKATLFVRTPTDELVPSQEDKLLFYSLFKQATAGPCEAPAPWFYEIEATAKWNAWQKLGDMTKQEAKLQYIELLDARAPNWRNV